MRVVSLGLTIALMILMRVPADAQATPVRVADSACSSCHRAVLAKYLTTPMANASGSAEEKLIPGTLLHRASGVRYRVSMQDGKAELSYEVPQTPHSGKLPLICWKKPARALHWSPFGPLLQVTCPVVSRLSITIRPAGATSRCLIILPSAGT